MDYLTATRKRLDFTRVCVFIRVNQSLPTKILIDIKGMCYLLKWSTHGSQLPATTTIGLAMILGTAKLKQLRLRNPETQVV